MVRTRSRKARDTQWTRDAVLNNPDLLCHIAEQADLPTACKLLTTSKRNLVVCADFFKKQTDYYDEQSESLADEWDRLIDARNTLSNTIYQHPVEYLMLNPFQHPVEYNILNNEVDQAFDEYRDNIDRFFHCRDTYNATRHS